MGSMTRKARRAQRKLETLTVADKTRYKEDDSVVLPTDDDAKYRRAYRALARALDRMPPDGVYSFDGRRMRLVQEAPVVVKGDVQ